MKKKGEDRRRALAVPKFLLIAFALAMMCQGCVVYEPVPAAYVVNPYDVAFDSALKAAEDVGIRISSADRRTGHILGRADSSNVDIVVARQTDGRMRIEFNLQGGEPGSQKGSRLGEEFYRAYDWHMGRR